MSEFGDIRLRDWRECGHHPVFPLRPFACVEMLGRVSPTVAATIEAGDRTKWDELTPEGWGQWISVSILRPGQIERLATEVAAAVTRLAGEG